MNRRRRRGVGRRNESVCRRSINQSIGVMWLVLAILLLSEASALSDGKISSLYQTNAQQPRHIQVAPMQNMAGDTRTRARLTQKQLEKKSHSSMKMSKDKMRHPSLTEPPKYSPSHAPSKYHDIFQMKSSPIAYHSKTDSPTNCGENGSSKSTKSPTGSKSAKSSAPGRSWPSKGKGSEPSKGKGSPPVSKGKGSTPSKGAGSTSSKGKGVPPSKGASPEDSKSVKSDDYYGQIEDRFDIFTNGQRKRRHLYYNFPTCAPSEQPSLPTPVPTSPVTDAPSLPTPPSTSQPTVEPSAGGGEPSTAAPTASQAPTSSFAPSPRPSTLSPTSSSPTPIPGTRVSVSAFDVLYTFENGVIPSPTATQYNRAATTTANYIDLLFRGAFSTSDEIIFVDSITTFSNFAPPGSPVTIEFNSELIFSLDSQEVPTQESLDGLVSTFFDPPPEDALIAALTSVPSSDPFNDVTDTTYQVIVSASQAAERDEGVSISSPGTFGIGAAVFVVILGVGGLLMASRRRRHRKSKHEMPFPEKSKVHPVGDETHATTQANDGVSLLSTPHPIAPPDEHEIEFFHDTDDSDVFDSTSTWEEADKAYVEY